MPPKPPAPPKSIDQQIYAAVEALTAKVDALTSNLSQLDANITAQYDSIVAASVAQVELLRQVLDDLAPEIIPSTFRVTQGDSMAITGIIPGATGTFTATPLDASGAPITATLTETPVWTSSDPLAVVTANPDGLGCTVVVDATAPQGGSFVLTIANPDGSASTPTTVPYDKVTPPPVVAASFSVNQTS